MAFSRLEPAISESPPARLDLPAPSQRRLAIAAAWVRRWFLVLLVGVYGLAMFAPGLGTAARGVSMTSCNEGRGVRNPTAPL
jgi:hypothetical protein